MTLSESVKESIKGYSEPVIYILFLVLVLGFSLLIESLSKKYKCLKNLW